MLRESVTVKPPREAILRADKSDTSPWCVKYSAETGVAYAIPSIDLVARVPFWRALFCCKKKEERKRNMKKTLALLLSVLMFVAVFTGWQKTASADNDAEHYPVTITTYNYAKEEVEVTFDKCPQRVVCTNQTQTELLLYFGLDEYIVGTAYLDGEIREDLQPQYEALKVAGKELTVKGYPSKETVLALEPDFIFGWRSAFAEDQLGDVSEWHKMGVGTMILRCSNNTAPVRDLEAVLADIADIGKIFNIEEKTNAYIEETRALMTRIADKVATLEAPYKAIIIEPYGGTFYCWDEKSLTGALVVAAGTTYALPDGGDLSVEDIVNINPDVIIVDYMDEEGITPEESKAKAIASVMDEAALAEVPAMKNGKVMAINLTDVYGGGIRMVPSVEAMFSFMYE